MKKIAQIITIFLLSLFMLNIVAPPTNAASTPQKYISSIFFATTHINTNPNNAKEWLSSKEYSYIDVDLNRNARGEFIYTGYTTTDNPDEAITDIMVLKNSNNKYPETITKNGYIYYVVGSYNVNYYAYNLAQDLNEDAGGDYIYLYVTNDRNAGKPLTALSITESANEEGWGNVYFYNTANTVANLNSGTKGTSLYMHTQRDEDYVAESDYKLTLNNCTADIDITSNIIKGTNITITKDKDLPICKWQVYNTQTGKEVANLFDTNNAEDSKSFIMPNYDVTIKVSYYINDIQLAMDEVLEGTLYPTSTKSVWDITNTNNYTIDIATFLSSNLAIAGKKTTFYIVLCPKENFVFNLNTITQETMTLKYGDKILTPSYFKYNGKRLLCNFRIAAVANPTAEPKIIAAPQSSLAEGSYSEVQIAKLTSENQNAKIYYTTDTTTPTEDSTLYTDEGITVDRNMILKAIAIEDGISSELSVFNYQVSINTPIIPTIPFTKKVITETSTVITADPIGNSMYEEIIKNSQYVDEESEDEIVDEDASDEESENEEEDGADEDAPVKEESEEANSDEVGSLFTNPSLTVITVLALIIIGACVTIAIKKRKNI